MLSRTFTDFIKHALFPVYIHIRIESVRACVLTCAVLFLFLFQFSSFHFILRLQYHLRCASFFARLIGLANAFKVAIHFTEWNLFAIYFGALESQVWRK